MYGLIGSFKATPGRRAELVSILLANVGAFPGCHSYIVAENTADPDTIWNTEVWDTPASTRLRSNCPSSRRRSPRPCQSLARSANIES